MVGNFDFVFSLFQRKAQECSIYFFIRYFLTIHQDFKMRVIRNGCDKITFLMNLDRSLELISFGSIFIRVKFRLV